MPKAAVGGVKLHYDEVGHGTPLVFVHEFAGDAQSWRLQTAFFARRYRTIAFNARGYPPSDVPEDPGAYSQQQAADDIKGVLDALVARARQTGARVTFVEDAALLAEAGGVGALLRFRLHRRAA